MQQTTGNTGLMVKKVGLLLAALALVVVIAAVPADAQQGEVRGPITATGVLGEPYTQGQDPTVQYRLTDEETGTNYVLMSGFVDLDPYVGQRVTVWGAPVGGADFAPPALNVTHIESAEENENGGEPEVQAQCFLPEGCFLSGDGSDETIVGGYGPDYIIGGAGDDAVHGLGGGDWLDGGAGDDLVRGNGGDNLVDGGSGHDLVIGGDGNDYVTGYTGNDILNAGGGSDYIYAADGEFDEVSGGPGYDVCVVDADDDDVRGCEEVYIG